MTVPETAWQAVLSIPTTTPAPLAGATAVEMSRGAPFASTHRTLEPTGLWPVNEMKTLAREVVAGRTLNGHDDLIAGRGRRILRREAPGLRA